MGWYLRKSVKFGPLRMNFSKSGIGYSIGVKGARIGTGPRGPYVSGGRGGLYFRQSLNTLPVSSAAPAVTFASLPHLYCTHCGAETLPNNQFCIQCGTHVQAVLEKHGRHVNWLVVVGILILIRLAFFLPSLYRTTPLELPPKEALVRDTKLDFQWQRDGKLMTAKFTVHNPTQFRFKDFEITCKNYTDTGVAASDINSVVIHEIVEPNSTTPVITKQVGVIHRKATSASCEITDLVPIR